MNVIPRATCSLLSVACAAGLAAQDPPPPPANYTVHEWGTFTSMVGRDGIALEGLQHEEEALPPFVHDLLQLRETSRDRSKMPASHVTQKMETPVIYFHSDEPLRVHVRVGFEQGLMSQFYPLPSTVSPVLDEARQGLIDLRTIDSSALTWDIDLIPQGRPLPREIPKCDAAASWQIAREVSAACVRTVDVDGDGSAAEAEHYLFYRGLGRWTPPLQLRCAADGDLRLTNGMVGEVPFVAALELGAAGGRFVLGRSLAKDAEQTLALGKVPFRQDRELVARELAAHVLRALTGQGLEVDEARAMVATWSRSWFQTDGARVIYLLPRQQVDQMLPLVFEPQPKAVVRVLVGRLEYITAAAEARVEAALLRGDEAALRHLDRFLEPHLRNLVEHGSSDRVRALARQRLAALSR